MPFFKNTSDDLCRKLLGNKFNKYKLLKEYNRTLSSSAEMYSRAINSPNSSIKEQFLSDLYLTGSGSVDLRHPDIRLFWMMMRDGVVLEGNGSLESYMIGTYTTGLSTLNPTKDLSYKDQSQALEYFLDHVEKDRTGNAKGFCNLDSEIEEYGSRFSEFRSSPKQLELTKRISTIFYFASIAFEFNETRREEYFGKLQASKVSRYLGISSSGLLTLDSLISSRSMYSELNEKLVKNYEDRAKKTAKTIKLGDIERRREMALALNILPGQILILKGEDPSLVYKEIKSRVYEVMQDNEIDESITRKESISIANIIFLPYPHLLDKFNIDFESYFGSKISEASDEYNARILNYGPLRHNSKALENMHVNNGFNFDNDHYLRTRSTEFYLETKPLTNIQANMLAKTVINSKVFGQSHLLHRRIDAINLIDEDILSDLIVHISRQKSSVVKMTDGGECLKTHCLDKIFKSRPDPFLSALEKLTKIKKSEVAIEALIKQMGVPIQFLPKLSNKIRGLALEDSLGL